MTSKLNSTKVPVLLAENVTAGFILMGVDGGGMRSDPVGLASCNWAPSSGYLSKGEPCIYIDNGDGSGHMLRKLHNVVYWVQDGHLYEVGPLAAVDSASLTQVRAARRAKIVAEKNRQLLAAGLSADEAFFAANALAEREIGA